MNPKVKAVSHTPGPWEWVGVSLLPMSPSESRCVSKIMDDSGCTVFRDSTSDAIEAECAANKALIAAAPELLAALKLFTCATMGGSNPDGESHIGWQKGDGISAGERLQQARAAIAKATGQ